MPWGKLEIERVEPSTGGGAAVYRLSGLFTSSPEAYAFLEEMGARVRKHPAPIVLNLAGVEHMTSAGVGIIAACYTSATNAGTKVALAAVPSRAEAILKIVKLLDVVPAYGTEEEAIRALGA